MSLRHAVSRAVQGLKEQAPKYDVAAKISSGRKDVSSGQARRLSSAIDSVKRRAAEEKRRREEESLRTVMYLSCWGPN